MDEKGGAAVAEALNDLLYGQRFGIAQEKGRFFTPEQIFGNKHGAELRAYAEERGGFDTFPSNAYQRPNMTLDQMKPMVYGDNPPPAAEKELGPADFKTAKDYIAQFRKDHPGQEKDYPDADLIEYYNTEKAGKK